MQRMQVNYLVGKQQETNKYLNTQITKLIQMLPHNDPKYTQLNSLFDRMQQSMDALKKVCQEQQDVERFIKSYQGPFNKCKEMFYEKYQPDYLKKLSSKYTSQNNTGSNRNISYFKQITFVKSDSYQQLKKLIVDELNNVVSKKEYLFISQQANDYANQFRYTLGLFVSKLQDIKNPFTNETIKQLANSYVSNFVQSGMVSSKNSSELEKTELVIFTQLLQYKLSYCLINGQLPDITGLVKDTDQYNQIMNTFDKQKLNYMNALCQLGQETIENFTEDCFKEGGQNILSELSKNAVME